MEEIENLLANELGRHKFAAAAGVDYVWCVCLCWSRDRRSWALDGEAFDRHLAKALTERICRDVPEQRGDDKAIPQYAIDSLREEAAE